jgi:2-methylcitrate dehydratase PrpD
MNESAGPSAVDVMNTRSRARGAKKAVALSGVAAGNTAICTVGRTGTDLRYRGYDIHDLARQTTVEEVAHLLVRGALPTVAELTAYQKRAASFQRTDPRIDRLREQMVCVEDSRYSREYLDPDRRSIANAVQIFFTDGSSTDRVEVEFPVGHRRRRAEGVALLTDKFRRNLLRCFAPRRANDIVERCDDPERLALMPVHEFVDLFV